MTRKKRADDRPDFAPLVGQFHAHRATVDLAALVMHVSRLHQLLEIIGNIGSLIVAARLQFARRNLVLADIEQQECLNGVDVQQAQAFEFVLDHVQQKTMQPFHHTQGIQVIPLKSPAVVECVRLMKAHEPLRQIIR